MLNVNNDTTTELSLTAPRTLKETILWVDIYMAFSRYPKAQFSVLSRAQDQSRNLLLKRKFNFSWKWNECEEFALGLTLKVRDLELGNDLFFSLTIFTSWYEVSQAIIFMCVSKKFNLLFTHSLHSDLLDKDFVH